jgi:protein TonB
MMDLMIDSGRGEPAEAAAYRITDFVRIDRAEVVESKETKPQKPETPEAAPDMPRPQASESFDSVLQVAVATPDVQFGTARMGDLGFSGSDGEYLPIVKVAPVYPTRALQRRLEGYVLVEFVVTATGAVRNVAVLESTSPIFEQPAIEAALKFKYKPRVVDGQAIEVAGVQNKITFRLGN